MISRSEAPLPSPVGRRIVFVGPAPLHATRGGHAGGQLTAAVGIAGYAAERGISMNVIDTFADTLANPSMSTRIWGGMRRVRALWRALHSKPDAVILFVGARISFFERTALAAIARLRGVEAVFCIRDGAFTGWMNASMLRRKLVASLLRIPRVIVVQGERARDAIVAVGVPRDRVTIVRNWLPASVELANEARTAVAGQPLRFIYTGWLVAEKGLRELLEACGVLAGRYSFELELIGGGPLEAELRSMASARGITGVQFSGWLPRDEVLRRVQRSHVFVLPSYFEGFPNSLLEAMAFGLAAVCSDVGAIAETLRDGECGYVVPAHDPVALANALEHYLARPELVATHGASALAVVKAMHDRRDNLDRLFACIPQNEVL